MTYSWLRAFLIFVLLLVTVGCREVPTTVKLAEGPSFLLRGSGRLASFRIYGPQPGHKIATPFDDRSLVWRIQPVAGYFKGARVGGLNFRYGMPPSGYMQTMPKDASPASLPDRQVYYFFVETSDAPPASGYIYLEGGRPIEIGVPDLCQSGFVGEVKPLKCGTNEPYKEPENLEQFVQEHRLEK